MGYDDGLMPGHCHGPNSGRRLLGGARFFLAVWCLLSLHFAVCAQSLDQVQTLAANGTTGLALSMVEDAQQSLTTGEGAWFDWERLRLSILGGRHQWRDLIDRVQGYPPEMPVTFSQWAATRQARAWLQLGDGARARAVLVRLIWGPQSTEPSLSVWRRLVIRSYMLEGRGDDAFVALQRYRRDYGDGGDEGRLLSAQVLLAAGHGGDAAALLRGMSGVQGEALRLVAVLRSGAEPAQAVLRQSKLLARRPGLELAERAIAWAVVAEAAPAADDGASRVVALESLYADGGVDSLPQQVFHFSVDDLWQAYVDYADAVGNREQLLVGDDKAWFAAAEQAGEQLPVRSRSLYAMLALGAHDPKRRLAAHRQFLTLQLKREHGIQLVRSLYLNSRHFPTTDAVPEPVRRDLVDVAIGESDIQLASRLMQGLDTPPGDLDRVRWQLRRAKVFILGGDYPNGEQVLSALVAEAPTLRSEQRDRLVQVLFDLQSVGENEGAFGLFQRLFDTASESQFRREMLYWMADSRMAQQRPRDAAYLYLRSATLEDSHAMDPWAQTARYQAAKALGQAGLVGDARNLYEQLLAVTADASRRAVLRRDLQQLWLHREGKTSD